jgi:O-acetyl-ADP-ribose deacetylase (regulator of RNase III)
VTGIIEIGGKSMLSFVKGNLFESDTEAIVNTVNCVGVMGRGIALQVKKRYPGNFVAYERACKRGEVAPGKMFVYETQQLILPKYIINFPTKRHWRGASKIEDIILGLADLQKVIGDYNISSIAIPPLGAGLGGLDWQTVKREIDIAMSKLDRINVIVYEPGETPEVVKNIKVPKMTPGRAALIELIRRYLNGLLDPVITLLEIHKLMYFLQKAGEPLRLNFTKAHYGPYAENLRHVLNAIEGYFITGYVAGGDAPDKTIELVPGAADDAEVFLSEHCETQERLNRVNALVQGFETPFGVELLSTVHWLVTQNGASTLDDVIRQTYEWNERKRQFSQKQIEIAVRRLADQGWVSVIV